MRGLRVGDTVAPGDVILTTQDGIVQIVPDAEAPVRTAARREVPGDDIDRVIAELDEGRSDVAPAAGLGGGAGGSLDEGLRVARIGETIDAGGTLPASEPPAVRTTEPTATAVSLAEPAPASPVPLEADSTTISALEQGAPTPLGLAAPTGAGANATLTVTQVPAIGAIQTADGTPVTAGTTLTAAELSGLVYVPPQDYDGSTPVGGFGYTVTSGAQSAAGTTSIALGAVNDAPVAQAATLAGDEDAVLPIALRGSDVDGTVAGVTIVSVPSGGTLLLADGATVVTAGQTLSAAQAATLLFRPAPDLSGSDSIAFTVTDDAGQVSAPAAVLLVVRPVNDAPAALADAISTPINTPLSGIAVLANDTDVDGDTLGLASATLADPSQGLLSVNADGTLDFTPATNVSGPVTVHYTVSDASGATASSTLTINVGGNTPPTGTDTRLTVAEDAARAFSATNFGFADADSGQALAAVRIDTLPAAGTLTFNGQPASAGQLIPAASLASLVFTPAPNANGSGYASFTFSVQDSAGGFDAAPNTITLDVTPQPDAAVIGGQASGATVEDTTLVASGTLSVVDPDAGQQAFVAQSSVAGAHGTFSIDAAGAWTYTLNNADPAVQALGQGQSLPAETFAVASVDGTTRTVSVSITGLNDPAAVSGVALGAVTEDGTVQTQGQLQVVDVDGPASFVPAAVAGTYGDFSIDAAGLWTYSLRNADANVQALTSAQHPVESFTVGAADGTMATVTVTVHGANEAPVAAVTPASGNEDAAGIAITLAASDIDGAVASFAVTALPANGTLMFAGSPVVANAVIPATAGSASLSFVPAPNWTGATALSFSAIDDEGAASPVVSQTITVIAVNDAPVASSTSITVAEASANTPLGLGAPSDVDGNPLTITVTGLPTTGTVTLADGTPVANGQVLSAAQLAGLRYDAPADLPAATSTSFGYSVSDGTVSVGAGTTIAIAPVNDAPVAVADIVSTGINTPVVAIAVLANDTDADGDALSVVSAALSDPSKGTVTVNADGTLAFTPATNVTGPVAINYTITDPSGATSSATVTVNVGNNTAPTGADTTVTLPEDGSRAFAPADFGFADADSGQSLAAVRIDALPAAGSLDFNGLPVVVGQVIPAASLGNLVFTPAPNANGTGYASFDFSVQDSAGAFDTAPNTITLDVTPVADAAAIGGDVAGATREDTTLSASGALTIVDPDAGEAAFQPQSNVAGAHGTFSVNAAGQWLYTLDNADPAVQALADGQSLPAETFTVRSVDGTAQLVAVTITGSNDGPTVGAVTFAVREDDLPVTGSVPAFDADPGATLTFSLVDPAPPGLTLRADGTYSFDASVAAYQSLGAGQTQVVSAPYRVTDEHGATSLAGFSIVVTGTNDAPVAQASAFSVAEDGLAVNGAVLASDVDGPGPLTYTLDGSPPAGLTFNGDGSYTFDPSNAAYQSLAQGASLVLTVPFLATDSLGASGTTANLVITVTGVNDAAAVTGVVAGTVTEDGSLLAQGQLNATDVDSPAGFTPTSVAGTYGNFTVDTNGLWSYTLRNGDANVQALTPAQHPIETFDVRTADGTVRQVSVTVNGANETPTASVTPASGDEDAPIAITLAGADVDGSIASFTITALPAHGTLLFAGAPVQVGDVIPASAGTASLSFVPAADWNGATSLSFSATDNEGATSAVVSQGISVISVNDAPVAPSSAITVSEASTHTPLGLTAPTDVDGNALTITVTQLPAIGTVTLADGTPVANGQALSASQLAGLLYDAPADLPAVTSTSFGYSVSDGTVSVGAVTTIDVTPVNDAPVAAADVVSTPINTPVAAIAVLANDTDADGDALSVVTAALSDPSKGTVTVNADGTLAFTPATNVTGPVAINYTITDPSGATSSATVTVHVGNNTAPTGADTTVTLPEDGSRAFAPADFGFADADSGQSLAAVRIDALPAAGSLDFNGLPVVVGQVIPAASLGSLVFTPAPNANGTGYASFDFSVQDSTGAFDTAPNTITLDVTPVADAAAIGGDVAGATREDTTLSASGALTIVDPDAGETSFQPQSNVAGAHGTFSVNAAGQWLYTLDNADPAVQALADGQSLPAETFTVRSVDGTAQLVAVTITGTNDAAVITAGSGVATEDTAVDGAGNITTGGTLSITDVDAGQAAFQPQAATAGAYGTLTLAANGAWTYAAANNNPVIQALGAGQTLTETFTVRSADGSPSSVTVTINGTNDAAVISSGTGSVTEDTAVDGAGNLTTGGTLTVGDVDAGQATFQAQSATAGTYGTFTLGSNGAWTYAAANGSAAIQALGAGQVVTDSFTVRSADGTTSSVVVTITGTNDAPVISAGTGAITEDVSVDASGHLTTGGTLTVSDADAGQAAFQAQAATAGAYGSFTLAANGAWTYTAANSNATIQALGAGQTLTETFTVRSVDGTASTVTVTITGTNDAAVISAGTGSVTEDVAVNGAGNITTGGTLTVSDVDAGQAVLQAQAGTAGAYGTFTLATNGAWTYTAANNNAAIQALGAGQTLTETFTVRSTDGSTSSVTVTINGTNDAAVISSATGGVTEDTAVDGAGNLTTGGTLSVTEVDAGQASFQAQAATAGTYGTFTLATNGAWTYTAANSTPAIQALGAGQTLTETFTVRSADGTASTVTVTINGTNDAAVISAGTGSVAEDLAVNGAGNITTGGTLTVSDADAGQASFQAQAATAGTYGTFTLAANGAWTYAAANSNATIQALGAGQTLTETFTVRSADGTASSVTVTITGTNDGPVAVADTGALQENATLTANAAGGVLANDSDSDGGDTKAVSGVAFGATTGTVGAGLNGTYGTLTLNADGSYSYAADRPAAEALTAGQIVTEQFSYTLSDAAGATSTATLTFTITGQDDAPTITGPLTGAVREDTTLTATGTLTAADADAGQSGFVAQGGVAGTYGSFSITADGVWTYTLNNAAANVQALGATSTLTETFAVATADGTSRNVVVTVRGLNDAPAAVDAAFTVAEDAAVVTGSVAATDADAGATLSYALTGAAPAGLTFNADGSYSFDASNAAYQSLRAGQSTVIAVPFQATDDRGAVSNTANLTITVTGTNDGPVAQADGGSLLENATLVAPALIGVLFNDIDADSGDSKTVSGVAFGGTAGTVGSPLAGTYGTLTLGADGGVVYAANRPAAEALAAGQVVTEQFTYTMRDASGATSSSTITFTITGQNDAATVTGTFAGTVREDVTLTATGTLTVTDADAGQSSFVAQSGTAGTHGSFSIDAGGAWTYTLNNGAANVQALGATSSLTETFTVATADGSTRNVVVTVNGSNDAPVAVAAAFSTSEDAAVVTGSVSATDVDAGATRTYALTGAAPAGLIFNADGSYSFDPSNAAYQSLRAGQSTVITVPFQATDDRGAVSNTAHLTITVTGTNDAPVAQADVGALDENATLTRSAATGVLANDTDIDAGDTKVVSAVAFGAGNGTVGAALNGTYGTLTLNADGSYSYVANRPAAEALTAGQVVTEQFGYTVRDASGATSTSTLTFTITGQNDAPTITGPTTGTVREDTTLTATGTLTAVDPDAGQSAFVAQSGVAGTYGSFSITAAGVWTYTLNNAAANVQALGATSSLAESFTVATADGTTRTVVVTVNGTNDAPTVVADSRTTTEDNAVSGNVLANDSDIDSASIAVTQFSFGGTTYAAGANATVAGVGTLTVASNGAYTFTPAANYAGAVPAVGYTVSDGSATSSGTLSLAITPVADAPTLTVNGSSTTGGTTNPQTLPPSVGLTVQYFDNIAAVSTSNAGTISAVEAGVESSAATSTSTATDVSVASISVDDAYRFTGYIHLTGGTTYTIGGYRDDTLMVKLGGNSVYGVGFNNWGTLTGTAFTPAVSGYYSIEVVAYNGDGVGSLDLSMAVGNAAAVDLNTTNFRLYPSTASFASSGTVVGGLVPNGDGGYYPTSVVGTEDTTIPLGTIAAGLNDTDGSESLALRIGAIPVGATLADGTRTFTATAGATSVDVTGWTLNSLTLTPAANVAGDFTLDVIATSTDSNGSTAVSQSSLPVRVVATADLPSLGGATTLISMAQGNAATATLNLPVLSTLADRDGSETLSVTIAGVPTGATLNHGSSDGAGTWTVGGADLADLTITLPAGYSTNGTALTVTAIATEASNGATASITSSLTLVANVTNNTVTGTGGNDASLNGGGGNSRDFIDGQGGNDVIDARGGDDLVRGGAGDDSIVGANGNDVLFGDAGNDAITGGAGTDRIVGGAGNDTLTGGPSDGATDVFAWSLADASTTPGTPAVDTITDFNASAASAGGDVLDLRDLLAGDTLGAGNSAGNLANYLDFSVSTSGGVASTTIHISSSGAFANGNYNAAQEDQTIVLQGVNLPTAMGLASNASDAQIIQELVNRGKLIVDSGA